MVPHLLGCADLFYFAAVHQHHAVGHFQRFFLVVRDKNAGHVQVVVQAAQPAAQFFAHLGVQRAKGFVQQQNLGLYRQGTGQGNALALAAGELCRVAVGEPIELHQAQQRMHFFFDDRLGRPGRARLHAQAKGHVVKHRHVAEQCIVLKHKAHIALAHIEVGGVLAAEQNIAVVGSFQPGNDAQQRGFSAA